MDDLVQLDQNGAGLGAWNKCSIVPVSAVSKCFLPDDYF